MARATEKDQAGAMRDFVAEIERLNVEINDLENQYGRNQFYDGAIRDRLYALWRQRDDLKDLQMQSAGTR